MKTEQQRQHRVYRALEVLRSEIKSGTVEGIKNAIGMYEATGDHVHWSKPIIGVPCPGGDCLVFEARKRIAELNDRSKALPYVLPDTLFRYVVVVNGTEYEHSAGSAIEALHNCIDLYLNDATDAKAALDSIHASVRQGTLR